jgi:O-antigen/teichoic acid export membrane protein
VASIQSAGRWQSLASAQFVASIISLAVSSILLLATRSLLASAMQLLLTEAIFSARMIMLARRHKPNPAVQPPHPLGHAFRRDFKHLAIYSLFGWLQTQSDRVLLAWITGPTILGLYSLAWAVSRTVGDAVSFSAVNVLRPTLLGTHRGRTTGLKADLVLTRAVPLSAGIALATGMGAIFILPHVLGPEWLPAIQAVPIMALSIIPTLLSWCLTAILVAEKRLRWAAPIKAAGVVLSVPIAIAATFDLRLAAWAVVAREVVDLFLMMAATGKACPWKAISMGGLLLSLLTIPALLW